MAKKVISRLNSSPRPAPDPPAVKTPPVVAPPLVGPSHANLDGYRIPKRSAPKANDPIPSEDSEDSSPEPRASRKRKRRSDSTVSHAELLKMLEGFRQDTVAEVAQQMRSHSVSMPPREDRRWLQAVERKSLLISPNYFSPIVHNRSMYTADLQRSVLTSSSNGEDSQDSGNPPAFSAISLDAGHPSAFSAVSLEAGLPSAFKAVPLEAGLPTAFRAVSQDAGHPPTFNTVSGIAGHPPHLYSR